jgi:hypothetical protein
MRLKIPTKQFGLQGHYNPITHIYLPVKESEVAVPSDMMALGDGFDAIGVLMRRPVAAMEQYGNILTRHQGKANVVFCAPDPDYPWALFIHGEKGTLKISTNRGDFIPADGSSKPIHFDCVYERAQYPADLTEKNIELNAAPATRRHMLDFLAAIERRTRPVADIEQGHISTASCILANLAMKVGRTLRYDPRQRVVTGDPEATALLRRPYRAAWRHPEAG